jgi:hypothetical protein
MRVQRFGDLSGLLNDQFIDYSALKYRLCYVSYIASNGGTVL